MTNTRITDPEIVERRYPVLLRAFHLRHGSGGAGRFRGGCGAVREFEFLAPLSVGVLTERRALAPYGMHGGGDGQRGRNTLLVRQTRQSRLGDESALGAEASAANDDGDESASYIELQLGAKNTYAARVGDRVRIETPGGGGWGAPDSHVYRTPASNGASAGGASTTMQNASRAELGSVEQYRLLQEQA